MLDSNENSRNEELTTNNDTPIDISNKINSNEDKFESLEINLEKENILYKDSYYEVSSNPGKEQRKIGNTYAFCYKNGDPLIIIGPHCIYNLYIIYRAIFCWINSSYNVSFYWTELYFVEFD